MPVEKSQELLNLVVPCYNEEARLDLEAFRAFAASAAATRLILVNDGSQDGTLEILTKLKEQYPDQVEVLSLPQNSGKAEAVRQGVNYALALEPTPAYVAYWDADLATPLDAVQEFREVFDRNPQLLMVIGSRVKLLGRSIQRKAARHYLGRVFATAASMLLRLPVYDTQCGAKMFRVIPITRALFAQPFRAGWIFDVELLARLIELRSQFQLPPAEKLIYECPLQQWRDVAGSKIRLRHWFKAIWEFGAIARRYRLR